MKDIQEMLNTVIQGDCLEVMKQMPDKCVDLVLTDPPYGMEYTRHIPNTRHDKIENDDSLEWLPEALLQLKRVLKDNGNVYIFCSWHNIETFKIEVNKVFTVRNIIVWDKMGAGMGDLETTYGGTYELCIFANNTPQTLNGRRDNDLIRMGRSGNTFHPTEKPVELLKHFITKSSNENDTILDPFLGSGTTAVACKQLGRNYIGIELSQKYCDIANERLKQDLLGF